MIYLLEVTDNGKIIPGISREDILTAPFPLPPLAEQHRIVEKIEQLLHEIDKLKKKQYIYM